MSFIVASLKSAPQSVAPPIVTPITVTVELAPASKWSDDSSWLSTSDNNSSSFSWVSTINLESADNSPQPSRAAICLPEIPSQSLLREQTAEQFPEPTHDGIGAPQDVAQVFNEPVVLKKTTKKKNKKVGEEKTRLLIYNMQACAAKEIERTEQRDAEKMELANGDRCPNERCALGEYCIAHRQEMRDLHAPRLERVQSAPARIETTCGAGEYVIETRDTPLGWRRRPSLPISIFDVARRGMPSHPRALSAAEKADYERFIVTTFYKTKEVIKSSNARNAWKAKFAASDYEAHARKGPKVIRGGFEEAEWNSKMARDVSYTEAFLRVLKYELEPDEHQPQQDEEIITWILAGLQQQLEELLEAELRTKLLAELKQNFEAMSTSDENRDS
ncbi:hypothetical protein QFC21_005207 [Naganishia friedmannii]|uniref:Uncharacterized protein n=1 Tax=Naganishia friedmannii TaxID=89922 RepID=A0ACC2VAK8_9TREE|nr:hypothetical protein QFC21_005207 [Naganishia friedmannii]